MKMFRTNRLQPLLPLCAGLSLAACFATTRAADAPRSLDWSRAATGQPGAAAPAMAAPAPAPAPARGIVATEHPAAPKLAASAATSAPTRRAAKGLFSLDDQAIIIVGGKSTTAGAVKRALEADIAAKAGPPKTVKGGARKLDLALMPESGAGPRPDPPVFPGGIGAHLPKTASATVAKTSALQGAQTVKPGVTQAVAGNKSAVSLTALRCPDKGAPKIAESPAALKPGALVALVGECFGERLGRIELIGQFPSGRLALAARSWDNNTIEMAIPPVRGAPDHIVAVTVITAEGKASAAVRARFIATRERVEVPDRLWSPTPAFELAATAETSRLVDPDESNEAFAGHTEKFVHVQPQCALDTMDAVVHSGAIRQIRGWEQGPPNEASVTIDWAGACADTRVTTSHYYVISDGAQDIAIRSACRVAFEARAWAYCPAGIAP